MLDISISYVKNSIQTRLLLGIIEKFENSRYLFYLSKWTGITLSYSQKQALFKILELFGNNSIELLVFKKEVLNRIICQLGFT